MRYVIVGTAGHIDHGKTALVKALTGIDADRWEEEKRRGITIDLGFAHMEGSAASGEQVRFGFIDVPGHEKFVRNMLAGIGGIDMVLLIISAEEGVKPQTREHFDICRMLDIRHGITVITKSDTVDADSLEVVKLEVAEFLKDSFLDTAKAPLVAVSALKGTGLDELRRAMTTVALEISARSTSGAMRLPIDRVFTMKGHGTVVTGTLISGAVKKEDEVELLPAQRRLRVRSVQVHNSTSEKAQAGQRTAMNLAAIEPAELDRGMVLATPGLLRPSKRFDVVLTLLSSAKPLKDRARVHLHAFSSETVAEVVLIGETFDAGRQGTGTTDPRPQSSAKAAKPGTTVYAQLRTEHPLALAPDDRFIVRQFSPVITIGGGVVLDNAPMKMTRGEHAALLHIFHDGNVGAIVAARVSRRAQKGISTAELTQEMGLPASIIEQQAKRLIDAKTVVLVGELLVGAKAFESAKQSATKTLTAFHDANRLKEGISREELREQSGLGPEIFAGVLDALSRDKKLTVSGELVTAAGRGVAMKSEESESRKTIEDAFRTAGLKVPALKDVLASLKVDRTRAQQIVTLMLRDKTLVKLADELVFHKEALEALRAQVKQMKATTPKIDVAKFKDATGISRKYAIPLLEWLDRERVTRRVGDVREIL